VAGRPRTASPVFLIGDGVKGWLYGTRQNLAKLDQLGNLSYSVDFARSIRRSSPRTLGSTRKKYLDSSSIASRS